MGSSSSKPARTLAKGATSSTPLRASGGASASRPVAASPPSSSPSSSSPPQPTPSAPPSSPRQDPRFASDPFKNATGMRGSPASETKSQAVQDDARDPHLLANLQKLGQVSVPRGKVRFQPKNSMLSILSARQRDAELEQEANDRSARTNSPTSTQTDRMAMHTIIAMLDARKECRTRDDVLDVARGFAIDVDKLERLAKYVNAPSVDAEERRKEALQKVDVDGGDDGVRRIRAIWTEPVLTNEQPVKA